MKKKFLFSLLALVAMLGCIFGLVACGGGDKAEINAETDVAEIVSDSVTEAEWEAAFASQNFNNFKMRRYDFEGRVRNLYVADNLLYESTIYDVSAKPTLDLEIFLHPENSVTTVYVYIHSDTTAYSPIASPSNQWFRYEEGADYFEEYKNDYLMCTQDTKEAYSLYKYNSELKGYVLNDEEYGGGTVVKFKNKKCCCIYWFDEAGKIESSNLFYDYGKTKLTLPTVEE